MFVFTLESLVLRGCVRKGELSVLGFGLKAGPHNPGDTNSMRPSLPAVRRPDPDPVDALVGYPTKSICSGAGRSRRHAGSPRREIATSAILWWRQMGGSARAAAAKARELLAAIVAPAGETTQRLAILPVTQGGTKAPSR